MAAQRFTIPRDVYFGSGAIEQLKELKGTRAMIVIGSDRLIKAGTTEKVQALLSEAGIASQVFSGVTHDPGIGYALECAAQMRAYQPDLIIGIGGGSPIDSAKASWIFYEYPELTFDQAAVPFTLPEMRRKARFVAITTTAGTGTEVTSFSVMAKDETKIKYPIADYNITPDIAIVDPDLTMTLTPMLVAHTGMDALTHSIEAYTSTVANPITDALAIRSIEMIFAQLPKSFTGDTGARESMHIAQCMAGMAFSNAILGIVHSMAHKTGKLFGVPHGCANAIYLTYATQYNAKTAPAKYADIARRMGLGGETEAEQVAALVAKIGDLRAELEIPASLQAYGVDEKLFLDKLELISAEAVGDPCTGTNPREITPEQMKELFLAAYYGKPVDF